MEWVYFSENLKSLLILRFNSKDSVVKVLKILILAASNTIKRCLYYFRSVLLTLQISVKIGVPQSGHLIVYTYLFKSMVTKIVIDSPPYIARIFYIQK